MTLCTLFIIREASFTYNILEKHVIPLLPMISSCISNWADNLAGRDWNQTLDKRMNSHLSCVLSNVPTMSSSPRRTTPNRLYLVSVAFNVYITHFYFMLVTEYYHLV
jgi:hypothetical protein